MRAYLLGRDDVVSHLASKYTRVLGARLGMPRGARGVARLIDERFLSSRFYSTDRATGLGRARKRNVTSDLVSSHNWRAGPAPTSTRHGFHGDVQERGFEGPGPGVAVQDAHGDAGRGPPDPRYELVSRT